MKSKKRVGAIVGRGRSGSTWLGTIIDTHPEVAYRFEPFIRLRNTNEKIKECSEIICNAKLSPQDNAILYDALIQSHPLINKPPFFKKEIYNALGVKTAWLLSKQLPFLQNLFSSLYTPQKDAYVVFKEVTFEKHMLRLFETVDIPIIYLVRHPCGNVLSLLKGQEQGKMPVNSKEYLKNNLNQNDYLYQKYAHKIEKMSPLEQETLIWLFNLEMGVEAVRKTGKGLTITYEKLCEDAYTYAHQIFAYLGLEYSPQTEQFLDNLYSADSSSSKTTVSKDWMNSYFTVYRNPKKQAYAWKSKISKEDRQTIESMVSESESFQYCANLGGWD